jgi:chromate transporter
MPGPLAAQLAIALGYFQHGIIGATAVGLAFVVPSFCMVVGISMAYVRFGGLWWMQALFYGIGAAVIAIIAIAAYKLSRSTNKRDPLLWGVFGVLALVTIIAQAELAEFFVLAGMVVLFVRARPEASKALAVGLIGLAVVVAIWLIERWLLGVGLGGQHLLMQILLFFTKAGAFVFGSGLAIVPFLQQGVVQQLGWLNDHQFLDAVAVAMITPGPVVITVVFIGFLVAGLLGAIAAAIGIFLPVYVFTVVPAPWFSRNRNDAQLKAFVQGATAAATGALSGAVVVLAVRAIYDVPTALIALVTLAVLWRFRLPEPLVVVGAAAAGLAVWLLLQRG